MEKNKCVNCGAPIDPEKKECPYCNSNYSTQSSKNQPVEYSQIEKKKSSIFEDKSGCLNTLLTVGLFMLFNNNRRPPRRPR